MTALVVELLRQLAAGGRLLLNTDAVAGGTAAAGGTILFSAPSSVFYFV